MPHREGGRDLGGEQPLGFEALQGAAQDGAVVGHREGRTEEAGDQLLASEIDDRVLELGLSPP